MKNFSEQQKASLDKRSGNDPEAPKTTKALPIVKWTEAFSDCLHQAIGVRNIPLDCVIRADANVPVTGVQAAGTPHSTKHESIKNELIAQGSHGHALCREDNAAACHKLEEAMRATSHAASIEPCQQTKNGRDAWMSLSNQCAGNDKWEAEIT
jgi:hypothetical protein